MISLQICLFSLHRRSNLLFEFDNLIGHFNSIDIYRAQRTPMLVIVLLLQIALLRFFKTLLNLCRPSFCRCFTLINYRHRIGWWMKTLDNGHLQRNRSIEQMENKRERSLQRLIMLVFISSFSMGFFFFNVLLINVRLVSKRKSVQEEKKQERFPST